MTREITATYRLQLNDGFPLARARELIPYLRRLGVSHVYLSPLLATRPGSPHGYDVVDHQRINPNVGTEEDLRGFALELHARGMGIVLDIVPNHMSASQENRHWDDVLERGRASAFAGWFDIDWDAPGSDGKLVIPVLGDDVDAAMTRGELRLMVRDTGARIAYFDRTFPLDPGTLPPEMNLARLDPAGRPAVDEWLDGPGGKARLAALLDSQHYRLIPWRRAAAEVNYRRFFDVNELVGLRMDSEDVFDATHKLILSWVEEGIIDGLRVDHVDGLRFPTWYLGRLRQEVDRRRHPEAPHRIPIIVEKILSPDERLPEEWPVDGTTGYDFMNEVEELFIDPEGFAAIEATYRGLRHNPSLRFGAVARDGKRRALQGPLSADVRRVARLATAWRPEVDTKEFANAVVAMIVNLGVYRTYLSEPGLARGADRTALQAALSAAGGEPGVQAPALAQLEAAFLAKHAAGDTLRAEIVLRVQQLSGPAMAKGVEDTALYTYVPLASRNEVGGTPARPVERAAEHLHVANANRATHWPRSMLATNTHDTKRSADVRARLDALSFAPDEWARCVSRWRKLNRSRKRVVRGRPAPDTNLEYLYYQTLVGIWPAPRAGRRADDVPGTEWLERARERLNEYMLKAARESKTSTDWSERDEQYEKAIETFIGETLDARGEIFLSDVARLVSRIVDDASHFALARVLLHVTSPGTPDLYQGDEIWNFTLVDPDNRRSVDFRGREALLDGVVPPKEGAAWTSTEDRTKLAAITRLLHFRREHARLLRDGEYLPLIIGASPQYFAFARRQDGDICLVIARTRPLNLDYENETSPMVSLPDDCAGTWRSVLSERTVELSPGQASAPMNQLIPPTAAAELLVRQQR